MKVGCIVSAVLCMYTVAGCGGSAAEETETSEITTSRSSYGADVLSVPGTGPKPEIHVPPGPPPRKLVVKATREGGEGPAAQWGDRLGVRFVGVVYKTKKVFEDRWNQPQPFTFRFGDGEVRDGWETGLKGMRLGERRELTLPSRLAYGNGALMYVVELVEIEPSPAS